MLHCQMVLLLCLGLGLGLGLLGRVLLGYLLLHLD